MELSSSNIKKNSYIFSKESFSYISANEVLQILEVLNEVSVKFQETKKFIEEHLEQKCLKENISLEEVIYFSFYKPRSKELAQKNVFYCLVLGFKAETF